MGRVPKQRHHKQVPEHVSRSLRPHVTTYRNPTGIAQKNHVCKNEGLQDSVFWIDSSILLTHPLDAIEDVQQVFVLFFLSQL
jgi:hypothetical protein